MRRQAISQQSAELGVRVALVVKDREEQIAVALDCIAEGRPVPAESGLIAYRQVDNDGAPKGHLLVDALFDAERRGYIPRELRHAVPVCPHGTDVVAWGGIVTAPPSRALSYPWLGVICSGRGGKPVVGPTLYRSEAAWREAVNVIAQRMRDHEARKAARRKPEPHTFKAGDVLVASWGYDQTNVDFYEVVKLCGATMAEVRKVSHRTARSERSSETVLPVPGSYIGAPIRCRLNAKDARIEGHFASRWNGEPAYQTALGWGH